MLVRSPNVVGQLATASSSRSISISRGSDLSSRPLVGAGNSDLVSQQAATVFDHPVGPAHRIMRVWHAGSAAFEVVICPELIDEAEEVLTQRPLSRKRIALRLAEHFVEMLRGAG